MNKQKGIECIAFYKVINGMGRNGTGKESRKCQQWGVAVGRVQFKIRGERRCQGEGDIKAKK